MKNDSSKAHLAAMACVLMAVVLGLAAILSAQTTPSPRNLATGLPGGIVFVIAPNGQATFARLDSTLELAAAPDGSMVLRATAAPAPVDRVAVFKPTATGASITLPSAPQGNSLQIAFNGFVLSETEDYTRAGAVVTFRPFWTAQPGDTIQARYRE